MENLETDVMRFMAILGFCLVAVFALVQSLPAADPEPDEVGDIEPATGNDTRSIDSPLPAKKDSWPQSVIVEVREPALPKTTPTAPVKEVKSPVVLREPLLPATVPDSVPRTSKAPPPKLAEKPKPKLRPTETRRPRLPESRVAEKKTPPAEQSGFTLRFASDRVLESLVKRRSVALYAVAEGKVWQLESRQGAWRFTGVRAPEKFYSMERETVPTSIMQAFVRSVPSLKEIDVDWGVILPSDTSAQLRKILENSRGGELVIRNDGTVSLSREPG